MPKPFYFLVGIEEIAVGTWMRRNAEMPGVLTIEPQLDRKPAAPPAPGSNGHGSTEQSVLVLLAEGPKRAREIAAIIGGKPNRAHGALYGLKKKGLARSDVNKVWHATAQAGELGALPAPAKARKGPSGARAGSGAARQAVLNALAVEPMRPMDIKAKLDAAGVSGKSLSGVLDRGKRDGLIKSNADGLYELTAKGRKSEGAANG